MYQYGTNSNTSHYLQAVKSKLQAQKSNKETEYTVGAMCNNTGKTEQPMDDNILGSVRKSLMTWL